MTKQKQTFQEVATEVVRDSIRSAICIDDTYASAYSKQGVSKLNYDEPKSLYESFRKKGKCDLDIYQFKSLSESWDKEYMLANKDLMILDWELNQNAIPKHEDTLKILTDVIESNKIPFVVIYTSTPDLAEISRVLINYYAKIPNINDRGTFFDNLNKSLLPICEEGTSVDDFDLSEFIEEKSNQKLFLNYIHDFSLREQNKKLLIDAVCKIIPVKQGVPSKAVCMKLYKEVKQLFVNHSDIVLNLSYLSFDIDNKLDVKKFDFKRMESPSILYKINSTSVLVYHKKDKQDKGIAPEKLFECFSEAIVSNPHNYLSLLSLELKDKLREEFSKIGAKFSRINEKAFFFHMLNFSSNDSVENPSFNKAAIYDFVINSWLQDLNFNKHISSSKVVDLVDKGYERLSDPIPHELDNQLKNDIVKYSAFLTTNKAIDTNRKLQFGDVFSLDNDYFLCITPHCDCAQEAKINNNFYFIKGRIEGSASAIANAETGYLSFLNVNNESVCIKWNCKPFTGHIVDNNISKIRFYFMNDEIKLDYLTTLKENFTQRLSNEAFSYGYRVGIDLPHKKKLSVD